MTAKKWSRWASLDKPERTRIGNPFAHRNQDGRLEVFGVGGGALFNIWQRFPNAGWEESWAEKGKPSPNIGIRSLVVGSNQDGRQEVFALGEDDALWQLWQVAPNNGWSHWRSLGAPPATVALTDRLALGRNQDGRQEVFVLGTDGHIWQIWQTAPDNGWSEWKSLGQPPAGIRRSDRITLGRNEDGRQELFLVGKDAALWHIWQVAPNVGWGHWESLGKPRDSFDGSEPPKDRDLSEPLVQSNADGHLEVFAPGNGAFCNRWQEVWREGPDRVVWRDQGWNEKAKPRPNLGLTWLEAALNFEDRLEIVALGEDGALWHSWQIDVPPFWSQWESLGAPPVQIREPDRLTIGTNQDRRLEVFVADKNGAVWHTWEIR